MGDSFSYPAGARLAPRIRQIHRVADYGLLVSLLCSLFDQQHSRPLRPVVGEGRLPIPCGKTPGAVCSPWFPGAEVDKRRLRRRDQIQPGLYSLTTTASRLGAGYSCRVIDPVSLGAAEELYKSFSMAAGDRKYFSGASGIKITDKEHPFPGLGDSKMLAVKHSPFDMIPQVPQCGEDDRKGFPMVMR